MAEYTPSRVARLRHALTHLRCIYAAWPCSDGWYCGGCDRSWDIDGRPEATDA